jgi:hypothetical protein
MTEARVVCIGEADAFRCRCDNDPDSWFPLEAASSADACPTALEECADPPFIELPR